MIKSKLYRAVLLSPLVLAAWVSAASAYETYSTDGTDNCAGCHGDFRAAAYTSLVDGAIWGNLHDIHRTTMLSGPTMTTGDCNVCHIGTSRLPVNMGSSTGGTGLPAIGCLGCHGRAETNAAGAVNGAGLRQHHFTSGETSCFGCHADSDPGAFTTVGENTLPPYYATPDAAHPNKPTNPCNPNGVGEHFAGTTIGLDNDGDGLFDQSDTDCQVPDINLSPSVLTFGAVPAGGSATLNAAIRNLGTGALNVTAINLCAGTSTEFTWAPLAPFTLAPGANQTLAVTYAPVDEGVDTGCLAISSNDPDEANSQLRLDNSAASSILRFTPAFIHPQQTGGQ